ncbi:MAG: PTS transporter subunit EIIC [Negativicutes bacterium]|nr:PTS transporter subunit EIIC [Negativicutes bacterium]
MTTVEAVLNFTARRLAPVLLKVSGNQRLQAVRNGAGLALPFAVIGSLFILARSLLMAGWLPALIDEQLLLVPVLVSFGGVAVVVVLGTSYNLARLRMVDEVGAMLMALAVFLLLQIDGRTLAIDFDGLGYRGIFTAIGVALVTVEVYHYCLSKKLVIRLPAGVPPAVARSFTALIPFAVLTGGGWLLCLLAGGGVNGWLMAVVGPVIGLFNTLPGVMAIVFFSALIWSVGIHGDDIVETITFPAMLYFLAANAMAGAAGQPLPYIMAHGFHSAFVNLGGTGATLSPVLLMMRSKSARLRQLGRTAFPSGCFGINEPVTFGLPVVLNPVAVVPYVLVPTLLAASTYLLIDHGLITAPCIAMPWTMPTVIESFVVTGGDWRAAVWCLASLVLSALAYHPFLRRIESRDREEQEGVSPGKNG